LRSILKSRLRLLHLAEVTSNSTINTDKTKLAISEKTE
jgi:hypothetical protein